MKKFNTFTLAVSKFLEVSHWIAAVAATVLLVISVAAKDMLAKVLTIGVLPQGNELSTYGFELTVINSNGTINMSAITMFAIGAIFVFGLMAMVFRNVYLIFKTAKGKTWFAKGDTPFQKDITRMVREIGIFFISVPVIGLIMSVLARLVIGVDAVETGSINFEYFIVGILVLCLSQVFSYGTQLQNDVDGLV